MHLRGYIYVRICKQWKSKCWFNNWYLTDGACKTLMSNQTGFNSMPLIGGKKLKNSIKAIGGVNIPS